MPTGRSLAVLNITINTGRESPTDSDRGPLAKTSQRTQTRTLKPRAPQCSLGHPPEPQFQPGVTPASVLVEATSV